MSKFVLGLVAVCFICVGCGGDAATKSTGTAKPGTAASSTSGKMDTAKK